MNPEIMGALTQKTIQNLKQVIGDLHAALAESQAKNDLYEQALAAKEREVNDLKSQLPQPEETAEEQPQA